MMSGVAILDMDGTLLSRRSIDVFCTVLGLTEKLAEIDKLSPDLPAYRVSEMIAAFFEGVPRHRLESIFDAIPLSDGADEFVSHLKSKGFFIAIATDSYEFLAERLARKIGADTVYGNIVEMRDGLLTGKLLTKPRCLKIRGCRQYSTCKLSFMRELSGRVGGLTLAVGDGESDFCAISEADMGVAFRPKAQSIVMVADTVASNYSEVKSWLQREITTRRCQSR
jgi:phosphoserine phosphatase